MSIVKLIEKNFWVVLLASLIFGLFIPGLGYGLSYLIIPIFMFVLFLTFLKVDYIDILTHVKKPFFLFYVLFFYLLIVPAVVYLLFYFLGQDVAIAFLLLSAVPPGTWSPFFTDLCKGNVSLSITVSLMAYLFSPFTVSLLFFLLIGKSVHLDLWGMMKTLAIINFLPLIAAQIVRKIAKSLVIKTQDYFGVLNLGLLFIIVYIIVAGQAAEILSRPIQKLLMDVWWLYILFILLHLFGYLIGFWRKKEDKIALSVTKTYMNLGLAISLSATFFDLRVAFLVVLAEIPWNTTIGFFKYLLRYLK